MSNMQFKQNIVQIYYRWLSGLIQSYIRGQHLCSDPIAGEIDPFCSPAALYLVFAVLVD